MSGYGGEIACPARNVDDLQLLFQLSVGLVDPGRHLVVRLDGSVLDHLFQSGTPVMTDPVEDGVLVSRRRSLTPRLYGGSRHYEGSDGGTCQSSMQQQDPLPDESLVILPMCF
jgi:hypothetical protein